MKPMAFKNNEIIKLKTIYLDHSETKAQSAKTIKFYLMNCGQYLKLYRSLLFETKSETKFSCRTNAQNKNPNS